MKIEVKFQTAAGGVQRLFVDAAGLEEGVEVFRETYGPRPTLIRLGTPDGRAIYPKIPAKKNLPGKVK